MQNAHFELINILNADYCMICIHLMQPVSLYLIVIELMVTSLFMEKSDFKLLDRRTLSTLSSTSCNFRRSVGRKLTSNLDFTVICLYGETRQTKLFMTFLFRQKKKKDCIIQNVTCIFVTDLPTLNKCEITARWKHVPSQTTNNTFPRLPLVSFHPACHTQAA